MANQYTLNNDFSAIAEPQGTLYNVGDSAIELADADTTPKGQGILLMTGERRTFSGTLYARSMDAAATLNVSDFTEAGEGGDVSDVRRPSTAYTAGALVDGAGLASGLVLRCITAGTTSSAALDCTGYELGDTITDGTVTWTVEQYVITTDGGTTVLPATTDSVDLGSASKLWRKLYLTLTGKAELGIGYHRRTRKAFTLADLEAAVASGKYNEYDIEPGDYYTGASGYDYVFAGDNPMKGTHENMVANNHAGLIVNTHTKSKWNENNDTTGGYVASVLHSYLVDTVLPNVKTDLGGVAHLYAHKKLYTTSMTATRYNRYGVNSGASSNWAWSSDQYISALTEMQVYGGIVWSSSGYDTGEADQQLEVFRRFKHEEIFGANEVVWLRDIATATSMCAVYPYGYAAYDTGSNHVAGLVLFH